MHHRKPVDKVFLTLVCLLAGGGFFVFVSAAFGLLAREGASFESVVASQVFLGLIAGGIALIVFSRIHYTRWRLASVWIFIAGVIACAVVFIPGVGLEHGGATRWILIGPFSFQPAEFLKLGTIALLATLLSAPRAQSRSFTRNFLPFLTVVGIAGVLLLLQPDMGTYLALIAACTGMFIVAGGKWKHLLLLLMIGVLVAGLYAAAKPHARDRLLTFVDSTRDRTGSSWQIDQARIAVGSGEIFGKGFGQSVQKYGFLPEPVGDSIYAVASEEFGFVGAIAIVLLFILFLSRGLSIARHAPDLFGGLLVSGIVIMIASQAFLNIGAILGVLPLTGVPLLFVSHGGTALFFALLGTGVALNVSRYVRK